MRIDRPPLATSSASERRLTWLLRGGFVLLSLQILRTAWLSDDAFISFRTADNLLNGYGAVWNVGERVQAFTHPLWLGLCTLAFGLTRNVYYTAIALGMIVTGMSVWVLASRIALTRWHLVLGLAALVSSKAWIDYSTSGLENPLTHLLLMLFVWQWWDGTLGQARLQRLALLSALCALSRPDLIIIVAPALLAESVRLGLRASLRPLVLGFLPLLAWETFSFFYYGTPIPNTAYAKLTDGMPRLVRYGHGYDYVWRTATGDPATFPVMALAAFTIARERFRRDWTLLAGMGLYLLYVLSIGGDFMMGRFFTAPFVVSVAVVARAEWARLEKRVAIAAVSVLAIGLAAPWEPALLSGIGYAYVRTRLVGALSISALVLPHFRDRLVTDERRYYYESAGLLKVGRRGAPTFEWSDPGVMLRPEGPRVIVRGTIGFAGFYAGPGIHLIDEFGLADPLLARLPGGSLTSTIGHLERQIPAGYVETIASGENRLVDPNLAAYYDRLRFVVAGPLWSAARLVTAAKLLAHRDDGDLERYVAKTTKPAIPPP